MRLIVSCDIARLCNSKQHAQNFRNLKSSNLSTPRENSQAPLCVCHAPPDSITPGVLSRRERLCDSIMNHLAGVLARDTLRHPRCPRIQGGRKRRRRRGWSGRVANIGGEFIALSTGKRKHEISHLQQGAAAQSCCLVSL